MELSREQIYFLAGLITSQISIEIDQKLEKFKKELLQTKEPPPVKMIDRRKVGQLLGVTPDTITSYCLNGVIDKSAYTIINNRYKFFKDKIDSLIQQQKEGVWEPNKKYMKAL